MIISHHLFIKQIAPRKNEDYSSTIWDNSYSLILNLLPIFFLNSALRRLLIGHRTEMYIFSIMFNFEYVFLLRSFSYQFEIIYYLLSSFVISKRGVCFTLNKSVII